MADATPNELLAAVVYKGGATALIAMLCVCKAWRAALLAEGDRLWRTLAMERFPRLRLFLQHMPATHTFRILYRQQLAAECIAPPPPPPPPLPPLCAYIFAMEWRAEGGVIGHWSGEVSNHDAWLPVQWSGPSTALEKMRSDLHTFYAAGGGVENETQEQFEARYEPWCASSSWYFMKSFTVSLSVMRRSDMATLVLTQPEDEQEVYDSLDALQAIEIETQNLESPPCSSRPYGLVDEWYLSANSRLDSVSDYVPAEVAHASLLVNPHLRIGSQDFATSGVSVDAVKLGFHRRRVPAIGANNNQLAHHDEPVTQREVLRYLACHAPWPAAGVRSRSRKRAR